MAMVEKGAADGTEASDVEDGGIGEATKCAEATVRRG
jgi:hypothetical protein